MRQRTTGSGIDVKTCYTAGDVDDLDLGAQSKPGEFPFVRGIQETMYRGRLWTMRQYAGFASARESNARYRYLLAHGQTGLSVAFDLPTQMGYDSDSAMTASMTWRRSSTIFRWRTSASR
jgi:methylmalonyl-CoA mutase, N-terminal domain